MIVLTRADAEKADRVARAMRAEREAERRKRLEQSRQALAVLVANLDTQTQAATA